MSQRTLSKLSGPRFRLDYATSGTPRSPNSVLVALDGSITAEWAIPIARSIARCWNAPLRLVHVRNPVEDAQKMDVRLVDNRDSLSVQTRSGAYLRDLAESFRESSGVPVSWETATGVSIADTLRSICREDVRALVMARSHRSLLSRFWWGSVTDRLIGRLTVPLLIVPTVENAAARDQAASASGFDRVLAYFDGTDAAAQVVEHAVGVASPDAVCHLLRVLPLSSLYATGRRGVPEVFDLRNKAWVELLEARNTFEQHGLACKSRLIFDGQAAGPAIVDQARAMQARLIVVAVRQHLLPWWLRDGVAEYVVRHANVPVLIVPAEGNVTPLSKGNHVDFHSN